MPIDFAYRVHTAVGNHCMGAKINGRIVPLDYKLQTGDIVEVLTHKGHGPSRDWLKIVQTSTAKNRIRQWFKKEQRDNLIARGREALEKEVVKRNLDPAELLKNNNLQDVIKRSISQLLKTCWPPSATAA